MTRNIVRLREYTVHWSDGTFKHSTFSMEIERVLVLARCRFEHNEHEFMWVLGRRGITLVLGEMAVDE